MPYQIDDQTSSGQELAESLGSVAGLALMSPLGGALLWGGVKLAGKTAIGAGKLGLKGTVGEFQRISRQGKIDDAILNRRYYERRWSSTDMTRQIVPWTGKEAKADERLNRFKRSYRYKDRGFLKRAAGSTARFVADSGMAYGETALRGLHSAVGGTLYGAKALGSWIYRNPGTALVAAAPLGALTSSFFTEREATAGSYGSPNVMEFRGGVAGQAGVNELLDNINATGDIVLGMHKKR